MHKLACCGKFRTGFIIFLFLSSVSLPSCADDAKTCLGITQEKLAGALKKLNVPAAEILSITPSPLNGICEIGIQSQGTIRVFYTDSALEYLLFGNLIETKAMINLTADRYQKLQDRKRVDLAKISLNEGLAIGGKGATKKVIVFSDPD